MGISIVFLVGFIISLLLVICLIVVVRKNKSFYKSDTKVSVIILSHNYPKNLKKSIPILSKYKNINEIIILHSDPKHFIKTKSKKVKNVNDSENNKKYFTLRRFIHADKCKNNTILLLDDDIIPSRELLLKMLSQYDSNTQNCYGVISRLCDKTGYHTMSVHNNIVLSPILLSSKAIFNSVWQGMISEQDKLQQVIKEKGNAEDIYFQFMFQKIYEQKPIVIHGDYKYLNKKNRYSVVHPQKTKKLRNDFCKKLYKEN